MPANLCITPDLGKEDMDPEVSTRMIILSSKANVELPSHVEFAYYNQMDLLWGYD